MDVDVKLTATCDEGAPGDRVTVPAERAKLLIRGGAAVPATKTDAGKVGEPADTAATTRKP